MQILNLEGYRAVQVEKGDEKRFVLVPPGGYVEDYIDLEEGEEISTDCFLSDLFHDVEDISLVMETFE